MKPVCTNLMRVLIHLMRVKNPAPSLEIMMFNAQRPLCEPLQVLNTVFGG